MRIGSIVIHCYEFDRLVAFWRDALGYAPRAPATSDWVVLRDPEGKGCQFSDRLGRIDKEKSSASQSSG